MTRKSVVGPLEKRILDFLDGCDSSEELIYEEFSPARESDGKGHFYSKQHYKTRAILERMEKKGLIIREKGKIVKA